MTPLKHFFKALLVTVVIVITSCKAQYPDLEDGIYAEFVTTKGIMVAKLAYDKTPITVANFVSLAEGTNTMVDSAFREKDFYNGLIFHRVMDKFMIQGGDPTGTGSGGPGYLFMDEFHPDLKHDKPGILSMANSGPKTNGSQFFITEVPKPHLDNVHSIFGELVIGLDIQDSISNVKTGPGNKPIEDVVIEELNIIRKGKSAKNFDAQDVFVNHFAKAEKLEKEKIAKAEALLKDTKKRFTKQQEQATTLASGLKYIVTKKGTGKDLKETSKVLTNYSLYLEDGKILDTNQLDIAEIFGIVNNHRKEANQYQPIVADLSPNAQMIAGFKEGLQQLREGDKATLFIPYHLGYGETGNRSIPPRTNLIFEVEVLKLQK
ncbi:peptidylprolyl isomerase [Mariniflexile litorale]|uniref:peptidylprolyl isomerase n=1 Tax=Mariniflexile litorale TaxID=3045158 RepID=A0AAU7EHV4_9FLAO|nr:peptidylprolyl isomerase [Mariniflexile sp. KMM 9835]MDQ8210041.1 peptidylprolyl isomerase [Mariniflexile sp. KMM 9835]